MSPRNRRSRVAGCTPIRSTTGGFTLIEVMLAITLLALLLAGTFGAIRTTVRGMHSGEAAIDRTSRVRVAQEFMRRQISRILPLAYGEDTTGARIVFEGDATSMRFVAAMPGYLSKGGPYVQTLELVGGGSGGRQLQFGNEMLNGFDLEEGRPPENEPVVLLDQIRSGKFEYRTLDEDGELTDWSDQWDDPATTPVMVRIHLEMREEAQVTFPDLDVPLLIDVSARSRGTLRANRSLRSVPSNGGAAPVIGEGTRRGSER